MIRIKVNEGHEFELNSKDGKFFMEGQEYTPDIVRISPTEYHMLLGKRSYRIALSEQTDPKHFVAEINGTPYTLSVKDRFDILLDELGMDYNAGMQAEDVKAPMPGLVIDILVEPGEEVQKDTPLIILEAMKMENVLKAPGNGTIDRVLVNKRDAVEKGQVLIVFR